MSFTYTRADLKGRINAKIQNRSGLLVDEDGLMNEAARYVAQENDLRTMRRKTSLVPNLYNGRMEYQAPADFDFGGIIDVPAQAKRDDGSFFYVPTEEFYTKWEPGAIAQDNFNGTSLILINSRVNDFRIVISELDSITSGGGTWTAYGDAINLAKDTADFIKGAGSLSFDLSAAGGTTAGIENDSLNTIDLTDYLGGDSAIFSHARINDPTGITNYILQIGDNASNYYQKTITTRNDGAAFLTGWNLLRFDLSSLTTVGTPSKTGTKFVRLFMTKAGTKISQSSYKFDYLVLRKGQAADLKYYGNFPWNNSAGAYIENSTSDDDVLVCNHDEFQLFILRGRWLALDEVSEVQNLIDAAKKDYQDLRQEYKLGNPSEAKIQTSEYYNWGNVSYNGSDPDNYRPGRR